MLDYGANRVDPDEVAHYEPPHLDLHSLQVKMFSHIYHKNSVSVFRLEAFFMKQT